MNIVKIIRRVLPCSLIVLLLLTPFLSITAFAVYDTGYKNYYYEDNRMYDFMDNMPTPYSFTLNSDGYSTKTANYDRFVAFYCPRDNNYYIYYYNRDHCSVNITTYTTQNGNSTSLMISATATEMNNISTYFGYTGLPNAPIYSFNYLRSGLFVWHKEKNIWVSPSSYAGDVGNYNDHARLEQVANNSGYNLQLMLSYNSVSDVQTPYLIAYPFAFNGLFDLSLIDFAIMPDGGINYKNVSTYRTLGQLTVEGQTASNYNWQFSMLSSVSGYFGNDIPNVYLTLYSDLPDWYFDHDFDSEGFFDFIDETFNYNPLTNGFSILSDIVSTLSISLTLIGFIGLSFTLTVLAIVYGRR